MKKYTLLFLLLLIPFFSVKAEVKVKSFKCAYKINNYYGNQLFDMQIQIENYNDGSGSYTAGIYYKNEDGKYVKYTSGGIGDYANSDNNGGNYVNILNNSKEVSTFVQRYTETGKCPTLYYNYQTDQMGSVNVDVKNQDLYKANGAVALNLKGPNDNEYLSESEFYKRSQQSSGSSVTTGGTQTQAKDLNCSYSMKFDSLKQTSTVKFQRTTNRNNGNTVYTITVNDKATTLTNLNEDFYSGFGQYTGGQVRITSKELKNIFNRDECLPKDKIFHYLQASNADQFVYYITTDANEAHEEGIAGRAGDGTGQKTSQTTGTTSTSSGGSTDKMLEISNEKMNCKQVLGENLRKVLHLSINAIRVFAAIVSIFLMMTKLIPAISSKDSGALKKAISSCVTIAIVLVIIGLLPTIIRVVGKIAGFDLTCL